jgi:hypothetical protein
MRFIVDLFRGLILLFLALVIIGASWLAFMIAFGSMANDPLKLAYIAGILGGAVAIILGLGVTATFISIHDRIAEISAHSRRVAEALEMSAQRTQEA